MTPTVKNIDQLLEQELVIKETGEKLTIAGSISDAFGLTNLLVHKEVLPAGRRASSAHRHSLKEEIFIVLQGTPSVWVDGQVTRMQPGDVVSFHPNECDRMIFNDSTSEAVIITIGTNEPDDVVKYCKTSIPRKT